MTQHMNLLALETATECCSAALLVGDEIFSVSELAPRRHNELILPMCEQVLAQGQTSLSQLDAIAFGRGPGAFTGVRLAASVTQGIALAQELPVLPVSTLAALAQAVVQSLNSNQVFSCIDARMQEVYCGLFEQDKNGFMHVVGEEVVIRPSLINTNIDLDCVGVGSGWKAYADLILSKLPYKIQFKADAFPQAEHVAILAKHNFESGNAVTALQALPVYLRDNVAEKPTSKKTV